MTLEIKASKLLNSQVTGTQTIDFYHEFLHFILISTPMSIMNVRSFAFCYQTAQPASCVQWVSIIIYLHAWPLSLSLHSCPALPFPALPCPAVLASAPKYTCMHVHESEQTKQQKRHANANPTQILLSTQTQICISPSLVCVCAAHPVPTEN